MDLDEKLRIAQTWMLVPLSMLESLLRRLPSSQQHGVDLQVCGGASVEAVWVTPNHTFVLTAMPAADEDGRRTAIVFGCCYSQPGGERLWRVEWSEIEKSSIRAAVAARWSLLLEGYIDGIGEIPGAHIEAGASLA